MDRQTFLKYAFYCHRRPDRSFFLFGRQFPVCARCTGILAGYVLAIIGAFFGLRLHHFLVILLFLFPLLIDGTFQAKGYWESTNIRRCITGILAGIAAIDIILYIHFLSVDIAKKILEKLL